MTGVNEKDSDVKDAEGKDGKGDNSKGGKTLPKVEEDTWGSRGYLFPGDDKKAELGDSEAPKRVFLRAVDLSQWVGI